MAWERIVITNVNFPYKCGAELLENVNSMLRKIGIVCENWVKSVSLIFEWSYNKILQRYLNTLNVGNRFNQ